MLLDKCFLYCDIAFSSYFHYLASTVKRWKSSIFAFSDNTISSRKQNNNEKVFTDIIFKIFGGTIHNGLILFKSHCAFLLFRVFLDFYQLLPSFLRVIWLASFSTQLCPLRAQMQTEWVEWKARYVSLSSFTIFFLNCRTMQCRYTSASAHYTRPRL